MTIPRALNKQICRVLMGILLFAQFAVSSYACPGMTGMTGMTGMSGMTTMVEEPATAQDSMDPSTAMSPGCDEMDRDAVNLCAEHCRFGQQSVDTAPVPSAFVPVSSLLYWRPLVPEPTSGSVRSFPALDAGLAAPPPPHAILHCVFRI